MRENTTHLANDKTEQIYGANAIRTKKTLANRRERELANKNGNKSAHFKKLKYWHVGISIVQAL